MKLLLTSLPLTLLCLLASPLFSQTNFTGASSQFWNNAANWDNGLPSAGNDATIPEGLHVIVASTVHLTGYSLENFGTVEIVLDGYLYNHESFVNNNSLFNNEGYMLNDTDAQLTNAPGAYFELLNFGSIQNSGTISNFGSIFNNFGSIENAKIFNNFASLITIGTFFNFGAGRINNYPSAVLTNDGDFFNFTIIDNHAGGAIQNASPFENSGIIFSCFGDWFGTLPSVNPLEETTCPDQEICDGIDNDLDGEIDETCGCSNPLACNFDPYSFYDDVSCILPDGCTDPAACNYDNTAVCDDGSCTLPDGCTDPVACNYNAAALCDDGSCNLTLVWYIPITLNAGPILYSCDLPDGYFLADQACAQTVVDNDPFCVDSNWDIICQSAYNCCIGVPPSCFDNSACNYDPLAIACQDASVCTYPGCTDPLACNYYELAGCNDGSCTYPGCTNTSACNFEPTASCDDGSCILPGCTDPTACNFDPLTTCADFSCTYPGCLDPASLNYAPFAGCDDGSCGILPVVTFASQQNDCDDLNSLLIEGIFNAPNLVVLINGLPAEITSYSTTNATCLVPASITSGEIMVQIIHFQGVSNAVYLTLNVYGCTDPLACNFDPEAACDDASCLLDGGCTDVDACNFDPTQLCDDGSCEYVTCVGCTYPDATNYAATATVDNGSCTFDGAGTCYGDLDDNNEIGTSDLLAILGLFGSVCAD